MFIRFGEVPEYLCGSEYYCNLLEGGGDKDFEIDVGEFYPPLTDEVLDIESFKLLFYVYDMWIMEYPENFLRFMATYQDEVLEFLFEIAGKYVQAKTLIKELIFKFNIEFNFRKRINKEHAKTNVSNIIKDSNGYADHYTLKFTYENNFFILTPLISEFYINQDKVMHTLNAYGDKFEIDIFLKMIEKAISSIQNGNNFRGVYDLKLVLPIEINNKNIKYEILSKEDNGYILHGFKITKYNKYITIIQLEKLYNTLQNILNN